MTEVIVYGAGGHGKVVADLVFALGMRVAGFIDDGRPTGSAVLESVRTGPVRVLGGSAWLDERPASIIALGIGNNEMRERLAARCVGLGHRLATLVHPSAVISPFAVVGEGTVVMANAVLNAASHVGRCCIINTAAIVEHDVVVGDYAHISPNATLCGGAAVGAHSHVGASAVVIPLVSVGSLCVVGAGAAVIRDVPNGAKYVGVPARPLSR